MNPTGDGKPKDEAASADQPSPPQFVFGVDLDGVVVDSYGALRGIAAEWLGVDADELTEEVTWGLPQWNLDRMGGCTRLHRFAVVQRRLFAEAKPIAGAPAGLRRLVKNDDVRIRVITNRLYVPYFHREAAGQTIDWLDNHGIPYMDLCLLPDKAAVGADLYIDDAPQNVEALRAKGHRTIVYSNSTNRHLDGPRAENWEEVEQLVLDELKQWRDEPGATTPLAGR